MWLLLPLVVVCWRWALFIDYCVVCRDLFAVPFVVVWCCSLLVFACSFVRLIVCVCVLFVICWLLFVLCVSVVVAVVVVVVHVCAVRCVLSVGCC